MKTLLAVLALAGPMIDVKDASLPARVSYETQVPRRVKRSKPALALARFYGYASDRKGKGQKKREASQRHAKGWK